MPSLVMMPLEFSTKNYNFIISNCGKAKSESFATPRKQTCQRRRALSLSTGIEVECEASGRQPSPTFSPSPKDEHLRQSTFESAGRRRATTLLSISIPPSKDGQNSEEMVGRPAIRRAYSAIPVFSTNPSLPPHSLFGQSSLPFDNSPVEPNFSSLARTLAMANMASRFVESNKLSTYETLPNEYNAPHSPWPISAFSDYSSSECSTRACTPFTSDPFEFDTAFSNQPPQEQDSYFSVLPPPDDYQAFANAIHNNPMNYTFVLPSFPPKRLLEKRPNRFRVPTEHDPLYQQPIPRSIPSASTSTISETPLLSTRRHRPNLQIAPRSHSYPSTSLSSDPATPPVRRTNSLGDKPTYGGGLLDPPIPSLQSEAPESVSRSSNSRISQLFSPQSLLPPPSPPDSGADDAMFGHVHHQISPPHTPTAGPAYEQEEEETGSDQGTLKARPLPVSTNGSVGRVGPRHSKPTMSISLPPNVVHSFATLTMVSGMTMSEAVDDYSTRDMFPFDEILGQMI